ncbi:MAG: hydro-lyase, Fe-S type, tartrate/fumarate subfamily, beta subunit [Dehalococcoidia bacterium]|nr:hydro-lyase, Fe-S type, tartrate/fumarate subfamily, beta subunit [Dehalococcoidia bacterium]
MNRNKTVITPLSEEALAGLRAGDQVLLTGVIYTARDAAHRRIIEGVDRGEKPPIDLRGQTLYYVGPTPPRPGQVIGSAGPTTAYRMDSFTLRMLSLGVKATIGKGGRGKEVREAMVKHRAVYFGAIGGSGALLSGTIKRAEVVAYEDLGTEAIRRLEVVEFPVIVVNDIYGNDLLEQGKAEWRRDAPFKGAYSELPHNGG